MKTLGYSEDTWIVKTLGWIVKILGYKETDTMDKFTYPMENGLLPHTIASSVPIPAKSKEKNFYCHNSKELKTTIINITKTQGKQT